MEKLEVGGGGEGDPQCFMGAREGGEKGGRGGLKMGQGEHWVQGQMAEEGGKRRGEGGGTVLEESQDYYQELSGWLPIGWNGDSVCSGIKLNIQKILIWLGFPWKCNCSLIKFCTHKFCMFSL